MNAHLEALIRAAVGGHYRGHEIRGPRPKNEKIRDPYLKKGKIRGPYSKSENIRSEIREKDIY